MHIYILCLSLALLFGFVNGFIYIFNINLKKNAKE